MPIREYTPADLAALRALHAAQNFDYAFPDLADPLFVSKLVLEEDRSPSSTSSNATPIAAADAAASSAAHAHITAAFLLRLTCEAYLLLDPHCGTPRQRWQRIVALQVAATRDAYAKGLADAHCWLPPRIARTFGRRLAALGWHRDDTWTPFCKKL